MSMRGLNYANPTFFAHDKVGSFRSTGHRFERSLRRVPYVDGQLSPFTNVTKDSHGAITAITSTACVTCHSGNRALTPALLTEEEEEYQGRPRQPPRR